MAPSQRQESRQRAKELEQTLIHSVLMESQVIVLTCFACSTHIIANSDQINIDLIIVDESTQIIEPEILGVINLFNQSRARSASIKHEKRYCHAEERKQNENESDNDDDFDDDNRRRKLIEHYPGAMSRYIHKIKDFAKHLIMIGDPKQLSPVIVSSEAQRNGHGITWFHRILSKISSNDLKNGQFGKHKYMKDDNEIFTMLNVQYRGYDLLHQFNAEYFYHGKLGHFKRWDDDSSKLIGGFTWQNNKPFNFLAISSRQRAKGRNYENEMEANCVLDIVRSVLNYGNAYNVRDCDRIIKIKSFDQIGIIAMHVQQKWLIQNKIRRAFRAGEGFKLPIIETVDAFQGQQKDLIIWSLTRTDMQNSSFKSDGKRINVGLTRAKYGMIIVGNTNQFQCNNIMHHLGQFLDKRNLIKMRA